MARSQGTDDGGGPQLWRVAVSVFNKRWGGGYQRMTRNVTQGLRLLQPSVRPFVSLLLENHSASNCSFLRYLLGLDLLLNS
jgi:hypothetical protein